MMGVISGSSCSPMLAALSDRWLIGGTERRREAPEVVRLRHCTRRRIRRASRGRTASHLSQSTIARKADGIEGESFSNCRRTSTFPRGRSSLRLPISAFPLARAQAKQSQAVRSALRRSSPSDTRPSQLPRLWNPAMPSCTRATCLSAPAETVRLRESAATSRGAADRWCRRA